jgi:SAM-dependent methyltransferase
VPAKITDAECTILRTLYFKDGKHSSYHPVPAELEIYFDDLILDTKWRSPVPRLRLLSQELPHEFNGTIIDLGANTGFQTIEIARLFRDANVIAYEGNPSHASFLSECARILNIQNIEVRNEFARANEISLLFPGAILLDFNVFHHYSYDFDRNSALEISEWWDVNLPQWFSASKMLKEHWFSVGFNFGGDKKRPLFKGASPLEYAQKLYSSATTGNDFQIKFFFYLENSYQELDFTRENIEGISSLQKSSEFFQRPILKFF